MHLEHEYNTGIGTHKQKIVQAGAAVERLLVRVAGAQWIDRILNRVSEDGLRQLNIVVDLKKGSKSLRTSKLEGFPRGF